MGMFDYESLYGGEGSPFAGLAQQIGSSNFDVPTNFVSDSYNAPASAYANYGYTPGENNENVGTAPVNPDYNQAPPRTFAGTVRDVIGTRGTANTPGTGLAGLAQDISPLMGIGSAAMGGYTALRAGSEAAAANKRADRASQAALEAQRNASSAAAPMQAYGQEALRQASSGEVPAWAQAQINSWKQGQIAKANDYFGRMGLGNSESHMAWLSWIEQRAKEMGLAATNEQAKQGVTALGGAGNVYTGAGGVANQQARQAGGDANAINSLIAQANQQMNRIAGASA